LLAAQRLSDVLTGSAACWHLPQRATLSTVVAAAGNSERAA